MDTFEGALEDIVDRLVEAIRSSYEYQRIAFLALLTQRDESVTALKREVSEAQKRCDEAIAEEAQRESLIAYSRARENLYSNPRMKEIKSLSQRLEKRLSPLVEILKISPGERYAQLFEAGGER